MFEECTSVMSEILEILKTVQIQPVNVKRKYTIVDYYKNVSDFDRSNHDSRKSSAKGCYFFEKVMPIAASTEDREKLSKIESLLNRWLYILEVAPASIPVPSCLRCCCCKQVKRTSLGFFYK